MAIQLGSEGDEPGLIIDGVRIPFHMEAQVSYGPPPEDPDDWSDWDEDAPWMIRLPVEVQVTIPDEILHPPMAPTPMPAPRRTMPDHAGPDDPHARPAAWRPGDMILLPHGFPDDDPPTSARALETLGLGEAMRAMAGGRAGLPRVPGLIPDGNVPDGPGPADDDPAELAAMTRMTRLPGGGGGTGHRALDVAFAAGPIAGLHGILGEPGPTGRGAASGHVSIAIQPVPAHRAVDGPGIGPTTGGPIDRTPVTVMNPAAPSFATSSRNAARPALPPLRDPDALDPDRVRTAPQRGVREADQAPAVHPTYLLAQARTEDERDDPSDPLASLRTLEFRSALDQLRGIDPNNPELTFLAPPNWVPTQDAIDRVNNAIAAARAAKQAGLPAARPSWQQSERDVGTDLGSDHDSQTSFKERKPVPYGTPGSVRPDYISPDGRSASFEVKNYNLKINTSGLVNAISNQALRRQANLPVGMRQKIIIDVRGQTTLPQQRTIIAQKIAEGSRGVISSADVRFKR